MAQKKAKSLCISLDFFIFSNIVCRTYTNCLYYIFGTFLVVFFILLIEVGQLKKVIIPYFRYVFILVSAVIIALPQIIPTFQLTQYSTRSIVGGYQYATQYSLPGSHLASFISPYLYGNPKLGTYPEFPSDSGVFWENTPYIGELLFLLICVLYLYLLVRKKINIQINLYFFLAILFILLSLGKNSPLYFIYDIFPFNIFRTPAKYLLMAVFLLLLGLHYYLNVL